VRASIEGAMLCLTVEDDGVGLGDNWTHDRAGLGLGVTRERIAMLHPGRDADLYIGSRDGGGTRVRVLIPANTTEALGDE
jgi:signal transduction histidine kinase